MTWTPVPADGGALGDLDWPAIKRPSQSAAQVIESRSLRMHNWLEPQRESRRTDPQPLGSPRNAVVGLSNGVELMPIISGYFLGNLRKNIGVQ